MDVGSLLIRDNPPFTIELFRVPEDLYANLDLTSGGDGCEGHIPRTKRAAHIDVLRLLQAQLAGAPHPTGSEAAIRPAVKDRMSAPFRASFA